MSSLSKVIVSDRLKEPWRRWTDTAARPSESSVTSSSSDDDSLSESAGFRIGMSEARQERAKTSKPLVPTPSPEARNCAF